MKNKLLKIKLSFYQFKKYLKALCNFITPTIFDLTLKHQYRRI